MQGISNRKNTGDRKNTFAWMQPRLGGTAWFPDADENGETPALQNVWRKTSMVKSWKAVFKGGRENENRR